MPFPIVFVVSVPFVADCRYFDLAIKKLKVSFGEKVGSVCGGGILTKRCNEIKICCNPGVSNLASKNGHFLSYFKK